MQTRFVGCLASLRWRRNVESAHGSCQARSGTRQRRTPGRANGHGSGRCRVRAVAANRPAASCCPGRSLGPGPATIIGSVRGAITGSGPVSAANRHHRTACSRAAIRIDRAATKSGRCLVRLDTAAPRHRRSTGQLHRTLPPRLASVMARADGELLRLIRLLIRRRPVALQGKRHQQPACRPAPLLRLLRPDAALRLLRHQQLRPRQTRKPVSTAKHRVVHAVIQLRSSEQTT
jgi:hypothetical protein